MTASEKHADNCIPPGFQLAPLLAAEQTSPLQLCVLVREKRDGPGGTFVLLREHPEYQAYLGALVDHDVRVQGWVELWVQTSGVRDVQFSGQQEVLSNRVLDERWDAETARLKIFLPDSIIGAGLDLENPRPVVIGPPRANPGGIADTETLNWSLCKDDALLARAGLPPYSTTPFRYLHQPAGHGELKFLSTSPDAPTNSLAQQMEPAGSALGGSGAVFNPQGGRIRVLRHLPLSLEESLCILEGQPWLGHEIDGIRIFHGGLYPRIQEWSLQQNGLPFFLTSKQSSDRPNEILFLKLSLLNEVLRAIRHYTRAHQLPLLNISPGSFRVQFQDVGDQFPGLWTARCHLVRTGQAFPLHISSSQQRYFVRKGTIKRSPYLAESVSAHSQGLGSVRIRSVSGDADEIVVEGTLIASEMIMADSNDVLWLKIPLGDRRADFHAHIYTDPGLGPREVRFRTIPAKLDAQLIDSLRTSAGMPLPRSPYEIWPLLSSPCDLFSVGVIGIRALLAKVDSNLPVVVDEILSLSRLLGQSQQEGVELRDQLEALVRKERRFFELLSPKHLIAQDLTPDAAWSRISIPIWVDALALLLRLFPGDGPQSFAQGYGDVSPLALETVYDRPLQELESIILRLRSLLIPSFAANQEIASVIAHSIEELGP